MAQAKHVRANGQVNEDALRDVRAGLDTYRGRVGGTWNPSVVTSGQFSAACRRQAANIGVALVDGKELASRASRLAVTLQDVLRAAEDRAATFDQGVRRIQDVMN